MGEGEKRVVGLTTLKLFPTGLIIIIAVMIAYHIPTEDLY